jgi:hypothetical protein
MIQGFIQIDLPMDQFMYLLLRRLWEAVEQEEKLVRVFLPHRQNLPFGLHLVQPQFPDA